MKTLVEKEIYEKSDVLACMEKMSSKTLSALTEKLKTDKLLFDNLLRSVLSTTLLFTEAILLGYTTVFSRDLLFHRQLLFCVFSQLFDCKLKAVKELNPDEPRKLKKVTVTV